jgi:N-acetylmuramoyl-L-alanine amidase
MNLLGLWLKAGLFGILLGLGGIKTTEADVTLPSQGKWQGGTFPDSLFDETPYIGLPFLESFLVGQGSWMPDRQKFLLVDGKGRRWLFTLDNPYVAIDGKIWNLTYPVRRGPEHLFLPLHSLRRLLNTEFAAGLSEFPISKTSAEVKNQASRPLQPQSPSPSKAPEENFGPQGITFEKKENGTRIRILIPKGLNWQGLYARSHYLLQFPQGKIPDHLSGRIAGEDLCPVVTGTQESALAQLSLQLKPGHDTVEAQALPDEDSPPGKSLIEILVRRKPMLVESQSGKDAKEGIPNRKKTVILDPGHGGKDKGAIVDGTYEADITLAVSKDLKKELEAKGFRVLMTRTDDTYKTLGERPKFASDKARDLFISLHCNSIGGTEKRKRTVSGYTVYILREGESEEDKALARRENAAIKEEARKDGKADISPVEWILLEHQLNLYSKQSEEFTEKVVKAFEGSVMGKYSTGARQAGFYVLVGAFMPAILFEMGFLTHPEDRRIMKSRKGQKEIAQRLSVAVADFLSE